ncbi:Hypothetical predicted protein [Paramuricea clavata]|uniref:Uncharacterized protein n=1 Tax=Paramuricea clavata TaxID=317549 RepID=A0A6S7KA52_PARCT|nr:Hypothetical predicted protein [Paramuricea clavata]
MSAPNKKPNIDVLFLENVPSLSKIAGHKAIEQNEATAEEINTWAKEIAMRICQKHIGTEILENIHSLKRSVGEFHQQKLANLVLTLLVEVENDERKMRCDCAMRKQKRDYFTKICFLISKLLLEARGNDNRFENENMIIVRIICYL